MSSSPPAPTVHVNLGDRSYDVFIGAGLLARTGEELSRRFGAARVAIVTDENVAQHHLDTLTRSIGERGRGTIVMPPGEHSKSFSRLGEVCDRLLALGVERGDIVLALGGGVIGDLAGFAAAILRRGVRLVQIPTSLLAQVDSSVGGKTGINTAQGKNLVGAFHQPSLVLIDIDTLSTLPKRQMRAGYAEVVKYGLLGDAAFFGRLERNWPALFGNDGTAIAEAVITSVSAKAAIVARDETEQGERMLLNLGHTFGHALEAELGYGTILHGEAVAVGIGLAFKLSAALGLCSEADAARVVAHMAAVGLPAELRMLNRRFSAERLTGHMRRDKKMRDGALHFVLARGIGQAFTSSDVPPEAVLDLLRNAGCEA